MWPSQTGFSHPLMCIYGSSMTSHGFRVCSFRGLWTCSSLSHPLQCPPTSPPGDSSSPLPPVTSLRPQVRKLGPCAPRMVLAKGPAVCPGLQPRDCSCPASLPSSSPPGYPPGLLQGPPEPPQVGFQCLIPSPPCPRSHLSIRLPDHPSFWALVPGVNCPRTATLR